MRAPTPLRSLALAGLVLFSGACLGLGTDPAFGILQSVVAEGEALSQFARVKGGNGGFVVSGQIVGRLPCDVVRGDLKQSGSRFAVTVILDADSQGCNGLTPTTWSYIINVLNVGSGQQQVVVEYRFEGTSGQSGVVLDTLVTVL